MSLSTSAEVFTVEMHKRVPEALHDTIPAVVEAALDGDAPDLPGETTLREIMVVANVDPLVAPRAPAAEDPFAVMIEDVKPGTFAAAAAAVAPRDKETVERLLLEGLAAYLKEEFVGRAEVLFDELEQRVSVAHDQAAEGYLGELNIVAPRVPREVCLESSEGILSVGSRRRRSIRTLRKIRDRHGRARARDYGARLGFGRRGFLDLVRRRRRRLGRLCAAAAAPR